MTNKREILTFDDLIYYPVSILFAHVIHHHIGAPRGKEQRVTDLRERTRHLVCATLVELKRTYTLPMPPPAPVTMTVCPSNLKVIVLQVRCNVRLFSHQ